ncbi:MAG TPA: DUF1552 domain-containing protein [Phycisphaerae bacterium]|jgi:hypothetical protein
MQMTRRTLLRGLGTAVALPFLEAMLPRTAMGATVAKAAAGPRRVAWLYVPNGLNMATWTPETFGTGFELTRTMVPLAKFKDKLMVITGLVCDKANANGDGPGDHARAMSAYLTGAQPRKTGGADIKIGISVDQAIAEKVGHLTKFPSLELGIEEGKKVGACDSGYACAYSHNVSWRNETTPVIKDCNPQSVFDRLFGNNDPRETAEARAKREAQRRSVLDFVMDDAKSIQGKLGASDNRKVDEYLTSVREIEIRLDRTAKEPPPPLPEGAVRPAAGKPREYPDHAKLMIDMMVLAFQGDMTRIVTFPFASEGSDQTYPFADAPVPHHGTSHHMNDPVKLEYIAKINVFHMQQVAYLLEKLDGIQEGNGSILDNSLIAYGCGNSDGNRHNHDNLPFMMMGKGGGTIATGRHIKVDKVPINNIWMSMMDRMNASYEHLGDSTGRVSLT